jgi:hypothetical protein
LITVVGTGVGTGVTFDDGIDDGNSVAGIMTSDGCPGTVITVDGGDGIGETCDDGNVDGKTDWLMMIIPGDDEMVTYVVIELGNKLNEIMAGLV